MKRQETEPETRVGNCCGCRQYALLFKIQGIFRYRCDECFQKETGHRHHLAPSEPSQSFPGHERPRDYIETIQRRGCTDEPPQD